MTTVLQLKTSLFDNANQQGVSSQLSEELIRGLRAIEPGLDVNTRDFSRDPIPYLDGQWLQALFTPATDRTEEQAGKVAYSDRLIAELQASDSVVIGVPMYNFAIPAMLKSWTDHVARAGVTFKYTPDKGPIGLVQGKKVYLVVTMGGKHEEGVTDFMRSHLRTILGFLGMTDIETIVAEGLAMGEGSREEGLAKAREHIQHLLGKARAEHTVRAAAASMGEAA